MTTTILIGNLVYWRGGAAAYFQHRNSQGVGAIYMPQGTVWRMLPRHLLHIAEKGHAFKRNVPHCCWVGSSNVRISDGPWLR